MAKDLAWGEETPREIKKLMRATGSYFHIIFSKVRYQFYGVIYVQNI